MSPIFMTDLESVSNAVTTIDIEHLPADEVGTVAGEKAHRFGDVDCVAEPAERNVAARYRECFVVEVARRHQPLRHAIGEHAGTDAVGADAEASLFGGEGAHE